MLLKAQTESLIFLNFPRQIYEKSLICDLRLQFHTVVLVYLGPLVEKDTKKIEKTVKGTCFRSNKIE